MGPHVGTLYLVGQAEVSHLDNEATVMVLVRSFSLVYSSSTVILYTAWGVA